MSETTGNKREDIPKRKYPNSTSGIFLECNFAILFMYSSAGR